MTAAPRRCQRPPAGRAAAMAADLQGGVPVLVTDRLRLRAPRLDDLPLWTLIFAAPPFEVDAEQAWTEFTTYAAGWLLHGHGLWTVETREAGTTVGFVLLGLEWDDAEPEIGWMLSPDHRGRGYATEAAAAVRDHAIDLFGHGGAVSYTDGANRASVRVAERLGARRDAAAEAALGDPGTEVWRHGRTEEARA